MFFISFIGLRLYVPSDGVRLHLAVSPSLLNEMVVIFSKYCFRYSLAFVIGVSLCSGGVLCLVIFVKSPANKVLSIARELFLDDTFIGFIPGAEDRPPSIVAAREADVQISTRNAAANTL